MPIYDPAGQNWGGPQPGTKALRDEVKRLFPTVRTGYPFGIYANRPPSEHAEGRACDFGLDAGSTADRITADSLCEWAVRNADLWGIQSVIWNRRVWGFGKWFWRDYSGPSPHTDHVHIGQNKAAARKTGLDPTNPRWSDMATKEEVKQAVREVLDEYRFSWGPDQDADKLRNADLNDVLGEDHARLARLVRHFGLPL